MNIVGEMVGDPTGVSKIGNFDDDETITGCVIGRRIGGMTRMIGVRGELRGVDLAHLKPELVECSERSTGTGKWP